MSVGCHVQHINDSERAALDTIIKNGEINETDWPILEQIRGGGMQPERYPFIRLCHDVPQVPIIIGEKTQDREEYTRQFSIRGGEMLCVENEFHFSDWRDEIKHYSQTIYTPDLAHDVLTNASQHCKKFCIADNFVSAKHLITKAQMEQLIP